MSCANGIPMMNGKFTAKGLIASTFTPFTEQGAVNVDVIPDYADFLLDNDVKNVFVNGVYGEWKSLTFEERKQMIESWMWIASRLEHIVVHVGSDSQKEAIDLAEHAESLGVDAVCCAVPSSLQSPSIDDLVSFFAPIANAASQTPFYFYHLPNTCNTLNMLDFLSAADQLIPTFRGVIFASADLSGAVECMNFQRRKFDIIIGDNQEFFPAFAAGFDAAVGPAVNLCAQHYNNIRTCLNSQKPVAVALAECQEDQAKASGIVTVSGKYGNCCRIVGMKEAFRAFGPDVGPPRSPLRRLSGSDRSALWREVRAMRPR